MTGAREARRNSYRLAGCGLWVLLLGVTAVAVVDAPLAAPVHVEAPVEFNIPAQPVAAALGDFARQAHAQLFFISDGFEDVRANGVIGTYPVQQALDLLLSGTGLAAHYSSNSSIKVRPAPLESRNRDDERSDPASWSGGGEGGADLPDVLEEIVVTGTQIRGAGPVGTRVITLNRNYIEQSGLATTQELIQTVPQNFGAGANEANTTVGLDAGSLHFGFSSSVNLRGLGADSTLVVLNGRRSAPGGGAGGFVDPNSIPVSAIDRIELLPDGASAIYGSDAIGGVVNIITRSDYRGAETRLRYSPDINGIGETRFSQMFGNSWDEGNALIVYEFYDRGSLHAEDRDYTASSDLTPFGGTNHDGQGSNPGNIVRYTLADGSVQTVLFPIPAGQDGTSLAPSDLVPGSPNLQNTRAGSTVLPRQTRHSLFAALSRRLSERTELFAEARYSTRSFESFAFSNASNPLTVPATNPFFVDPFGAFRRAELVDASPHPANLCTRVTERVARIRGVAKRAEPSQAEQDLLDAQTAQISPQTFSWLTISTPAASSSDMNSSIRCSMKCVGSEK